MDHIRISGNERSSVILSQIKWFQKLKMIARKCQNNLFEIHYLIFVNIKLVRISNIGKTNFKYLKMNCKC